MFATILLTWLLLSIITAACAAFLLGRLSELDTVAAAEMTPSPKIIVLSKKMIHLQSVS